jgi:serine/threonine protein kinase
MLIRHAYGFCLAIAELHRLMIFHRDVSVDNILLSKPYNGTSLRDNARVAVSGFNFQPPDIKVDEDGAALLHDLDMAGLLSEDAEEELIRKMQLSYLDDDEDEDEDDGKKQQKTNPHSGPHRTASASCHLYSRFQMLTPIQGTLWYMSTRNMIHGGGHVLSDDVSTNTCDRQESQ